MTTIAERMRAAAEALRDLDTHSELRQQLRADADAIEAVEREMRECRPRFTPSCVMEVDLPMWADRLRGEVR